MSKLTLVFPIAVILFILLCFSECLPCLRSGLGEGKAPDRRWRRADAIALGAITLCYAVSAFAGLGLNTAPQSFCRFQERGQYALVELQSPEDISSVMYYTGLYSGEYRLQFSSDGENWVDQPSMSQKHANLFKWQYAELGEGCEDVKYLRIVAASRLWLGEIALFDGEGARIPVEAMVYSGGTANLLDEQTTVPQSPNYLNGAYFDEIYHARTAYEHLVNEPPYEISHPPLGKLIIAIGIKLFGMTPFGWRFMGTFFGVLMLPAMYAMLKRMFGGTAVPACVTAIFAFDFMHYVQTRIATIDTYGVFFTLLMYLFMYIYLRADRDEAAPRWKWLLPLALSGLCFGLGAACKWTCLYAGAGLGLIWLIDRICRFVSFRREGRGGEYLRESAENIMWCLLFFVLVPCTVYYMSYYPYGAARGMSGVGMYFSEDYLQMVVDNQKYMFSYHSGVDATHPYSSRWWQWMLDIRPMLYYLEYFGDGTKSSFGAFVNPMLCWGGLAAMLCMLYQALVRRDKKAGFILLGYLAQLLPWVFVQRVTFAYHYFPSTVFLCLALAYVFDAVRRHSPSWKRIIFSFTAVSLLLFAVFYPVLSGVPADGWYTGNFLRWLPETWPF